MSICSTTVVRRLTLGVGVLLAMLFQGFETGRSETPSATYGFGQTATKAQIKAWDIDIAPDGAGLPPGQGTVQKGRQIFLKKCAACHGPTGREGPMNRLMDGQGTLKTSKPLKTVGSYWPYATTLFDYVHRAMPFIAPQSLSPDEVYSLVAWILYQNKIIPENTVMDAKTLPSVRMPNEKGFAPDPRPDVPTR